jgi:hypothetical protein
MRLRILGLVAACLLAVAACGDDDAVEATSTSPPASVADDGADGGGTGGDETAADDMSGDDSAPADGGEGDLSLVPEGETDILGNPAGQGYVELDGVRYDFILNGACQKIFGGVQAAGSLADGADGNVDAFIPPEDWETDTEAGWDPPYVQIEIGDDNWTAQAGSQHLVEGEYIDLPPEQSSVTSFVNDGSLVAGDAVFFSVYNYDGVETASGSFEFYCP